MRTIYIAGPMSGHDDLNEPAFRAAAAEWEALGWRAIVPHDVAPYEHDRDCPPVYGDRVAGGSHDGGCYLRADLLDLLVADAAHFLCGWQESRGARVEHAVAEAVGLKRSYQAAQ